MHYSAIEAARAAVALNVERAPLLAALDYLNRRVVERRNTIPILSNVRCEAAVDGALILSAIDLDMEAAVTIPAAVDIAGTFTVSAAALRDLAKSSSGAIAMADDGDGRLHLTAGRTRNTLPTLPAADLPSLRAPRGHSFELDGAQLAIDLAAIAPFMSKDETRYYLKGALFEVTADQLAIVATDGSDMSLVERTAPAGCEGMAPATIPSKAIAALQAALKAAPCETVTVAIDKDRALFVVGNIGIVTKLIDGSYPNWRGVLDRDAGAELQAVMSPELEPYLNPAKIAAFAKAVGPLTVEMSPTYALITARSAPDWTGLSGRLASPALPKGYSYGCTVPTSVYEYVNGLRDRYCLPVIEERRAIVVDARAVGVTFGAEEFEADRYETALNYETFTEDRVLIKGRGQHWRDGSYSIFLPRCDRVVTADISVEVGGEIIPLLRHDTKGTLHATAAQVAAWCGPVDEMDRREIPALVVYQGQPVARDLRIPKPPRIDRSRALCMTAAEMTAYAEACRPVAGAPAAPAVEKVAAPKVAKVQPTPAATETEIMAEPVAPNLAEAPGADAALLARITALESIVQTLMQAHLEAPAHGDATAELVSPVPTPAVAIRDDRARRLRIVRRYLAMRAERKRDRAEWRLGQVQYDDMKARAVEAEQRAEFAESELSDISGQLAAATARAERAEAIAAGLADETQGRLVRLEREVATWQRRAESAGYKAPAFQLGALMSGRKPAVAA